MSEEKQADASESAHTGSPQPEPPAVAALLPNLGKTPVQLNPVVFLLFMIIAMVIVLAVAISRRGTDEGVRPDDPAVVALKADLEARRTELNRQRIALGLAPLEGLSEPIEVIGKRLKSDTDMLVGVSTRFQQMLSDKDMELSEKTGELLRSEKLRHDISRENARIQGELASISGATGDSDRLKAMLEDSEAQRDELSRELADTRRELAEIGKEQGNDYADLQRRYEEALRAKAFYESRVTELEGEQDVEPSPVIPE